MDCNSCTVHFGVEDWQWAWSEKIFGPFWKELETIMRADCWTDLSVCEVVGARRAKGTYRERRRKGLKARVAGHEWKSHGCCEVR